MAITTNAITNTFKEDTLKGLHDFTPSTGDVFKLELYNSENQSTSRYDTLEDWLKEYWENTIKLCYEILENKGKLCYILSGYGSHDKNNFIDLVSKMNEITKKYFSKLEIIDMHNKNVNSTKHRETGEKIMIFKK